MLRQIIRRPIKKNRRPYHKHLAEAEKLKTIMDTIKTLHPIQVMNGKHVLFEDKSYIYELEKLRMMHALAFEVLRDAHNNNEKSVLLQVIANRIKGNLQSPQRELVGELYDFVKLYEWLKFEDKEYYDNFDAMVNKMMKDL